VEEHPFRKLMRIVEGEELSPHIDQNLGPDYVGILEKLSETPQTADQLGVPTRMLLALCNAGYVSYRDGTPRNRNATVWSLSSDDDGEQITEEEMMSRKAVHAPSKDSTDGSSSPLSTKRRRGLSPKAAKALFSK
jgi:hypothetical protein